MAGVLGGALSDWHTRKFAALAEIIRAWPKQHSHRCRAERDETGFGVPTSSLQARIVILIWCDVAPSQAARQPARGRYA